MKLYQIEAEYKGLKDMEVEVKDGKDPMDPANWISIRHEHDMDCNLWDVNKAQELDERGEPKKV